MPRRIAEIGACDPELRVVQPPSLFKSVDYLMLWYPRLAADRHIYGSGMPSAELEHGRGRVPDDSALRPARSQLARRHRVRPR